MWSSQLRRRVGSGVASFSLLRGTTRNAGFPAGIVASRTETTGTRMRHLATTTTAINNPSSAVNTTPTASPSAYVTGPTTHFGNDSVPVEEKASKVREVFESVAESYDVMNDLMSAGLHRYWKDELLATTGLAAAAGAVRRSAASARRRRGSDEGGMGDADEIASSASASSASSPSLSVLDVAGGTGDVAFRFVDAAGCSERSLSSGRDEVNVTVCDINSEMLRVGERRARSRYGNDLIDKSGALKFVQGDAQSLPFEDETFDLYTISFGLRNVTDVDAALKDALRVLKPGGRYLCLEFSRPPNPTLSAMYDAYSFSMIPAIGELVADDRASYQYLVESIRMFCDQEELKLRMEKAGFVGVTHTNMTGGVVAVHGGWKSLK